VRVERLYRWAVQLSDDEQPELRMTGVVTPGGDERERSGRIVSLEFSTLRAVDREGQRYRLLSPLSLDSVAELKAALVLAKVNVTWHGWPYRWDAAPAAARAS
jgi:hypothetical protein